MDKVNITIIGAGVVGLAVAKELSNSFNDIVVLEKWDSFGRETSSRNSEVIHAGIYYPSGSLKARFCVEGKALLYELCQKYGVPHKKTGKIIVATNDEECEEIESLYEKGKANGVTDLQRVTAKNILSMEPHISVKEGLYSGTTGIVDTHGVMKCLESLSEDNGVTMSYNCEVMSLSCSDKDIVVTVKDADQETFSFASGIVINCAGLFADKVSAMAGIRIEDEGFSLKYYKGEYFSVSGVHRGKVKRLIYPPPTPFSLGLHTVVGLDETLKLGPNAFPVEKIEYSVNEKHKHEFYHEAIKYLPFIRLEDLEPDMSGIRPKLFLNGDLREDFFIRHEKDKGCPGFINLVGIESPGFTCAPMIAKHVKSLIQSECF